MHEVFASLFNDRAIAYRVHQGFDHTPVALSAGVQHMVRSDLGASGVMFTLDTDSGFRDVVFITASYGLGETVVQGAVNPDEFYVYKPALRAGRPRDPAAQPRRARPSRWSTRRPAQASACRPSTCRATERARFSHQRRGRHRARAAGADHRAALRLPDGHRMGQGRRDRASSTSCRRGPRPCRAARAARSSASRSRAASTVLAQGRSIGQRIGAGPGAHRPRRQGDGARADAATCWSPT